LVVYPRNHWHRSHELGFFEESDPFADVSGIKITDSQNIIYCSWTISRRTKSQSYGICLLAFNRVQVPHSTPPPTLQSPTTGQSMIVQEYTRFHHQYCRQSCRLHFHRFLGDSEGGKFRLYDMWIVFILSYAKKIWTQTIARESGTSTRLATITYPP